MVLNSELRAEEGDNSIFSGQFHANFVHSHRNFFTGCKIRVSFGCSWMKCSILSATCLQELYATLVFRRSLKKWNFPRFTNERRVRCKSRVWDCAVVEKRLQRTNARYAYFQLYQFVNDAYMQSAVRTTLLQVEIGE